MSINVSAFVRDMAPPEVEPVADTDTVVVRLTEGRNCGLNLFGTPAELLAVLVPVVNQLGGAGTIRCGHDHDAEGEALRALARQVTTLREDRDRLEELVES